VVTELLDVRSQRAWVSGLGITLGHRRIEEIAPQAAASLGA
jgi:hypothetical protein